MLGSARTALGRLDTAAEAYREAVRLRPDDDVGTGPFMDTAAVLTCLDLFITSDTAVAHLAGALGVPVWMPLSTTPDWRWLTGRSDNPWYPTMRIFRQKVFQDWAPVFDQIATELRKIVPANLPTRSVVIETAPGELIDKITILEIKAERITDPDKLHNVRSELDRLRAARDRTILPSDEPPRSPPRSRESERNEFRSATHCSPRSSPLRSTGKANGWACGPRTTGAGSDSWYSSDSW